MTSKQTAKTVDSFTAKLRASTAQLTKLKAECARALVLAETEATPANIKAADAKRKDVATCKNEVADFTDALQLAEQEHQQTLAAEAAASLAAKWDKVDQLQQQRAQEAEDVETAAADLVAKLEKIAATSKQLSLTIPATPPGGTIQTLIDIGLLGHGNLAAVLRVHLAKLGWRWIAPSVLWEHGGAKTFGERVVEANAYIGRMRPPTVPAASE